MPDPYTDSLVDYILFHGLADWTEEQLREHKKKTMKLVVIESPFAGDTERHITYARRAMRDSCMRGEAPLASHLLYTQEGVLNDNLRAERAHGIEAGLAWAKHAQAAVVYQDYGTTPGMAQAIERHRAEGRELIFRMIGLNPDATSH